MKHKSFVSRLGLGLMLLLWSIAAFAVFPPSGGPVNDAAGLLQPEDLARMEKAVADAYRQHGIEVVVVVIDRVSQYESGRTIESFAGALFDHRGIGSSGRNDGVLVLLAAGDRQVRIELGKDYGHRFDDATQRLVDGEVVPHFRQGDWVGGLFAAVEGIGPIVTAPPPAARPVTSQLPRQRRKPRTNPGDSLFELLGWTAAAGFVGFLVALVGRAIRRRRPMPCPRCRQSMVRLDDIGEDAYLDQGQLAEEDLGTVDYDVWFCRICAERVTKSYASWFRRAIPCPECGYKTVSENRTTLEAATTYSTGTREITQSCVSCSYEVSWQETIPMETDDDDWSGGGSSGGGGGSSGGGGATGSW